MFSTPLMSLFNTVLEAISFHSLIQNHIPCSKYYIILFSFFSKMASFISDRINKFVRQGGSVTLDCSVRKSKNPMVTWSDNVFSETSSINIFEASREGNKKNDEHDKGSHFEVDLNSLALTINGVTEEFVGSYTCRSKVGDDQFNVSYNLAVYGEFGIIWILI